MDSNDVPFWRRKTLEQLTATEWEQLCDGCARCCLLKLEDEETSVVHLTRMTCSMLDSGTCRCTDYANRHKLMPDCVEINPEKVRTIDWLPSTCAYRLVGEGKDLFWWHPLVSGSPDTVHEAGISVRGWSTSEAHVKSEQMYRYIIRDYGPRRRPVARPKPSAVPAGRVRAKAR